MQEVSDDIRRESTVQISEFAVLSGIQFVLNAGEVAAPDHFVGLLSIAYIGDGVTFCLPTPIRIVLSHFGFYKVSKRMCMDLVLVTMRFSRVTDIDWFSSGGSDDLTS